jgi:hypothetical protein
LVAVAVAFAYSLPNKQKTVISTEAAHGFIVSSAAEKSASLPQISPSQHRAVAVTFCPFAFAFLVVIPKGICCCPCFVF